MVNKLKQVVSAKKKYLFLWGMWIIILYFLGMNYVKVMIPNNKAYVISNPYTMDSVWETEGNEWHNDVLLYTFLQNKEVHIHPESWYCNYVSAFSSQVVKDEKIVCEMQREDINLSEYVYMNHMVALAHDTLFEQHAKETIASQATDGAAELYIDVNSLSRENAIIIFQDEVGNLYLKGYSNE